MLKKELAGIQLTDEQVIALEKQRNQILEDGNIKMAKLKASFKSQIPLIDQALGSLKNALQNVSLYNVTQRIFSIIENSFRNVIQYAKELDSAFVDIQIASGMTRAETNKFMKDLNSLGNQLGMTTQEMAEASNDWLRAGFRGNEVVELTKASASLAQLGMINTADATSYLISSLKGWKLEASEVMSVVDKLTSVDMAAAISAGDLAEAMSRANNSAQLAGIEMNRYIGLLTVGADITQRAPESIGQAWNTLIARISNVKAGKFVASQEDMEAEDYDEEEFANLNDVETVLSSVGIKLRENYGTWRDTQDIIEDIAKSWNKWDKTTQNAVSTAVAGTRQREIFGTTMSNYDQVSKYEQIAENSYGSAQEKMKAYTDSTEASIKRIQNGLEKFALLLNETGVIKAFYDAIGFVTNNFLALTAAVTAFIAVLKGDVISKFFSKSLSSIGTRAVNFGSKLSSFSFNPKDMGNGIKNWLNGIKGSIEKDYTSQLKTKYSAKLNTEGMSDSEITNLKDLQEAFLFSDTLSFDDANSMLQDLTDTFANSPVEELTSLRERLNSLNNAITEQEQAIDNAKNDDDVDAEEQSVLESGLNTLLEQRENVEEELNNLKEEQRDRISKTLATDERYQNITNSLISGHQREYDEISNNIRNRMIANNEQVDENIVRQQAIRELLESNLTENELQQITRNLGERRAEASALLNMARGMTVSVAGIAGTAGLGNWGQQFFGDNGQIVGSMIGGMAASGFTNMLFTDLPKVFTGLFKDKTLISTISGAFSSGGMSGLMGALSSTGVVGAVIGLVGIAGIAIASVIGMQEKARKERVEKQAKEFEEASNKYQTMLSQTTSIAKFDELSKGVDSLGRNVALTDEEYKEFLDLNTTFAEQFPGLIKYTDSQGQAFIGAAEGANSLTESIENMLKVQKHITNQSMLAPDLLEQTYKDAKEEYDKNLNEYNKGLSKSKADVNYNFGEQRRLGYYDDGTQIYSNDSADGLKNVITITSGTGDSWEDYEDLVDILKDVGLQAHYAEGELKNIQDEYGNITSSYYSYNGIQVDAETQDDLNKIEEVKIRLAQLSAESQEEINSLKYNLDVSAKALSDVFGVVWNELKNGYKVEGIDGFNYSIFDNMTDDEEFFMKSVLVDIRPSYDSVDEWMANIGQISSEMHDILNNSDNNVIDLYLKYQEADTIEDFNKYRRQFAENMLSVFGDEYHDKAVEILVGLGFTFNDDETEIESDLQNKYEQINKVVEDNSKKVKASVILQKKNLIKLFLLKKLIYYIS